jgi:hypothetical protein
MSSVSETGGEARRKSRAGGGGADDREGRGGPAELVTLTTVYDPVEAQIILAKLHSAGIAAYSHHEAMSVVYGLTVDGLGRQDIVVREEDLIEARAALELVSE